MSKVEIDFGDKGWYNCSVRYLKGSNPMLANYHTHTKRCYHAWGEDREFVENAIKGGMKVLGFSDHCPWVFDDGFVSVTRMAPAQLDEYFKSLTDLKNEYKNDIKIYIGFESEYIPELMEKQNELFKDYPLDYMIMGQHTLHSENRSVFNGVETDDESRLEKYVDLVIEGLETGKYKYVAHPDLLNFVGSDEIYKKHYTRLCRFLKERNIPVEINMLGLSEKRHYPTDKFFEIAKSVGNKAIIGCDAHIPKALSSVSEQESCALFAKKYGLELVDFLDGLGK